MSSPPDAGQVVMPPTWMKDWIEGAAAETLERLSPAIQQDFKKKQWRQFETQLAARQEDLFQLLHSLYGWRYDFSWILEAIIRTAAEQFLNRPRDLRRRDRRRSRGPQAWVNDHTTVWAVSEKDQFAGTANRSQIDQLRTLGITHLHLLADRTRTKELARLVHLLSTEGISVVLDLNNDSIQPALNGHDPKVLTALCSEVLRLANLGAAVVRLDTSGFLRTSPEAWANDLDIHLMIQILRVVADVSAPTLELAVDPGSRKDDSSHFVNPYECRLGDDDSFSSLIWDALATADTSLLRAALANRPALPEGCSWLTYLRSHQRVPGTMASLTGLEAAVEAMDPIAIDLEVRRILGVFSLVLAVGGIPVIFLADTVATYSEVAYHGIRRLLEVRRSLPGLSPALSPELLDPGDESVIAFRRGPLLVAVNMSDRPAVIDRNSFGVDQLVDLVSGEEWDGHILGPYEYRWLAS